MLKHPIRRGCQIAKSRHRGATLIFVLVSFAVMMGFCAFAVDLGRAEAAKTELRRAADAAARAAVAALGQGNTAAQDAAIAIAANNTVDGATLTLDRKTDIQIGNWDTSTRVFTQNGSPTNAVKIFARRTTAAGDPIPMIFAQALGKSTLDVWASSVAAIVDITSVQITVSAHSNLWLAGQPLGTEGSKPDPGWPSADHPWEYDIANPDAPAGTLSPTGEPYDSPPMVTDSSGNSLALIPGDIISISNTSGQVQNDPHGQDYYADGDAVNGSGQAIYDNDASHLNNSAYYGPPANDSVTGQNENGISDLYVPIDSLIGVFMPGDSPNSMPVASDTPSQVLNFSDLTIEPYTTGTTDVTVSQVSQEYASVSPKIQQSFYAGNGQQGPGGTQQQIVVPAGAGSLFLGTMDGHEWSNNVGSFTATVTQSRIELVQ
jgi:Flp pilus assembly protein TadG